MKTSLLTLKIEPQIKKEAQKIAANLGLSLSAILNGYIHQLIKTKTVYFSHKSENNPTKYLLKELEQAEAELKSGDYYSFEQPQDAVNFIDEIIAGKRHEN